MYKIIEYYEDGLPNIVEEGEEYEYIVQKYLDGKINDLSKTNTIKELFQYKVFEEFSKYQELLNIPYDDNHFKNYKELFQTITSKYNDYKVELIEVKG